MEMQIDHNAYSALVSDSEESESGELSALLANPDLDIQNALSIRELQESSETGGEERSRIEQPQPLVVDTAAPGTSSASGVGGERDAPPPRAECGVGQDIEREARRARGTCARTGHTAEAVPAGPATSSDRQAAGRRGGCASTVT